MASRELVLGIGGGIAAYKSAELLRRLKDSGFLVTVVPTQASLNFVGSATWEALSGRPVQTNLWNNVHQVPHIQLAKKADGIVIAPATADLIARIASGRADDFLTNVVLASPAPLILVPAMHSEMWLNPATVANVALLRSRGITVVEPDDGRLTGEDSGPGRYPEVPRIIQEIEGVLDHRSDLSGKTILISAGGTREAIDPVRFIGNHSSGKQGYAIASEAAARGAKVHLVAANVSLPDIEGVSIVRVTNAEEMLRALSEQADNADAVIMTAAVADARPQSFSTEKIHKDALLQINLERNPDIIATLSTRRRSNQLFVGFAAETEGDLIERGLEKLRRKNLDLLYVNDVSDGAVFGEDTTAGWLLAEDHREEFADTKEALATRLLDYVSNKLG